MRDGLYQLQLSTDACILSGLKFIQSAKSTNFFYCVLDNKVANNTALHSKKIESVVWHKRLGHPCNQVLSSVFKIMQISNSYMNIWVAMYILVYVDDILLTKIYSNFIWKLVANLNTSFALKDLGELSYFLDFKAHKSKTKLMLCQAKYA